MTTTKTIDNLNDVDIINSDIKTIQDTAHFEDVAFDTKTADLDVGGNLVCDGSLFSLTQRSSASNAGQNALQPALSHTLDSNTGMFFDVTTGDKLGFSAAGVERMSISDTDITGNLKYTNTQQPAMLRRRETTESIPSGVYTKLTFPTQVSVQNNRITYSAGDFTVLDAGWYMLWVDIFWASNGTGNRAVRWRINGDAHSYGHQFHESMIIASSKRMSTSALLPLAANDIVFVEGVQSSGGNLDHSSTNQIDMSEVSIVKLF